MRAGLQLLSYLRRLCLRVASAAVESGLCMSPGALPGPDPCARFLACLLKGAIEGLDLCSEAYALNRG